MIMNYVSTFSVFIKRERDVCGLLICFLSIQDLQNNMNDDES